MTDDESRQAFLQAAEAWVCDGYYLDVRYIGGSADESPHLWDAFIRLNPVPPKVDLAFRIESAGFVVGQIQAGPQSRSSLMAALEQATTGRIEIPEGSMKLYAAEEPSLYSEAIHRDRWFSDLHLQVAGQRGVPLAPNELARIDSALRRATPPCDGLTDVVSWLGLAAPGSSSNTKITIRINPPADLDMEKSGLVDNQLNLEVIAHQSFDPKCLGLSIRSIPEDGLTARQQVGARASRRNWSSTARRAATRHRRRRRRGCTRTWR